MILLYYVNWNEILNDDGSINGGMIDECHPFQNDDDQMDVHSFVLEADSPDEAIEIANSKISEIVDIIHDVLEEE